MLRLMARIEKLRYSVFMNDDRNDNPYDPNPTLEAYYRSTLRTYQGFSAIGCFGMGALALFFEGDLAQVVALGLFLFGGVSIGIIQLMLSNYVVKGE